MYLSAAPTLTRADYEAPVYRNILDMLGSIEHMNAQVFDGLIRPLLTSSASRDFLGFAINKTRQQSQSAGVYLIATELLDLPAAQAKAAGFGVAALLARLGKATTDPGRVRDIIPDLQDESENLVREMNRVRLPMPTDLRNWARRMEDLSYKLPAAQWQPTPFQAAAHAQPRWIVDPMSAYEICYQAKQMMGWIPAMRLSLDKEIAIAGLKGKLGTIDLELEPSARAIRAAKDRETVGLLERQTAAKIDTAKRRPAALTPTERQIAQTIPTKGLAAAIQQFGQAAVTRVQTKLRANAAPAATPRKKHTVASASGQGLISGVAFVGVIYWLFFRE